MARLPLSRRAALPPQIEFQVAKASVLNEHPVSEIVFQVRILATHPAMGVSDAMTCPWHS